MKKIFFLITMVTAALSLNGQNFNYTVSVDSVAWNELNAQTILNTNNSPWAFSYKIPIGFTFPFAGGNFDSLTIETNGYLVFDNERNYAITCFSGLGDRIDTSGNHAVLGYELSGITGNRILKIQYLNCGSSVSQEKNQSWQIWLNENGSTEIRTGPGSLRFESYQATVHDSISQTDSLVTITTVDSSQKYRVGLINMNMDSPAMALLIKGNPGTPTSSPINSNNPDMVYLESLPAAGLRYVFTQSSN